MELRILEVQAERHQVELVTQNFQEEMADTHPDTVAPAAAAEQQVLQA